MIVVVPEVAPGVTTPVPRFTVATDVLLLVHVPLGDPLSLSVIVELPVHIDTLPDISTAGVAFTVMVIDAGHVPR